MSKLRKIIPGLADKDYKAVEENLIKNKADNFLFLLQSYRSSSLTDNDIIDKLSITSNSLYVLKSRLYDKIQESLSGDIYSHKEEVVNLLHQVPDMCVSASREVTTAFLLKLEKELLIHDMHNELLVVYSALKKIHLYSEKYFHYSQLYNKHIAFSLSVEKSEEILGNFTRVLGQYNFSRSPKLMETLLFLRREIIAHYELNKSRQIEVIKNIIELQLSIFFKEHANAELDAAEILQHTEKLIREMPESSSNKTWITALEYLFFEYYRLGGQGKQATAYFEKVNAKFNSILLYTNICLTSKFLVSKLNFMLEGGRKEELLENATDSVFYDVNDKHTVVLLGIYNCIISYYKGNYKEAITRLNEVINENSFRDYFHIQVEIKLTLVFIYITIKEYDLADNILKNTVRKVKQEKLTGYENVLSLVKVFNAEIKQANSKVTEKQKTDFILFMAKNNKENEMLVYLLPELKRKYS